MANIIDMPKLSDTMTVGTLVKWLKKEGDAVKTGDMLAEVETDKATMELESFFDGTLLKIFIPAGSQVPIGAPLCAVGKPGETIAAPEPAGGGLAAPKPAAGEGGGAAPAPKPAPDAAKPPVPQSRPEENAKPAAPALEPAVAREGGRLRISPLARKLAEEKGIDPGRVTGSGPGGRIVRADIEAAGKSPGGAALRTPTPSGPGGPSAGQADKSTPVSNIRALIARRLLESKTRIPHFYLDIEVDAEPMLTLRSQLNAAFEKDGVKLSVNDFILKAAAEALRRVPAVNCSWEEPQAGQASIRQHGVAHVSFAVAIEDGLITPVIRDTQAKSLLDVSREAKSLAKLAKEKKLQPAQYTGGTFCVSNLGMFGIERFSAIINPPNAAILAVGATVKKPVVKDDQIVIGQRMTLTLSCDHRVVDGATGAIYLGALKDLLEKPVMFLL
jgi:pyruvate dehydrogenase E2 component (dihydrolipoamide acetyltransferase)